MIFPLLFLWQFVMAMLRNNWLAVVYWIIMMGLFYVFVDPGVAFTYWDWPWSGYLDIYAPLIFGSLLGLVWWRRPQWHYQWNDTWLKRKAA